MSHIHIHRDMVDRDRDMEPDGVNEPTMLLDPKVLDILLDMDNHLGIQMVCYGHLEDEHLYMQRLASLNR